MGKFSQEFIVKVLSNPEETTFQLSGPIVETSIFPIQLAQGPSHLRFEMKEVSTINSGGIHLWMQWMKGIKALLPNSIMTVYQIPMCIIDQMNYIKNFFPAPYVVKSLYLPYFCNSCQISDRVLLEHKRNFSESFEIVDFHFPENLCTKCQTPMEIDVFPERYFKFLTEIKEQLQRLKNR